MTNRSYSPPGARPPGGGPSVPEAGGFLFPVLRTARGPCDDRTRRMFASSLARDWGDGEGVGNLLY